MKKDKKTKFTTKSDVTMEIVNEIIEKLNEKGFCPTNQNEIIIPLKVRSKKNSTDSTWSVSRNTPDPAVKILDYIGDCVKKGYIGRGLAKGLVENFLDRSDVEFHPTEKEFDNTNPKDLGNAIKIFLGFYDVLESHCILTEARMKYLGETIPKLYKLFKNANEKNGKKV